MFRESEILVRNLARAALIGLALMPALVYSFVKYTAAQQMAVDDARVQAQRAGYVIAANPEAWRYATERFTDQIVEIRHDGTRTTLIGAAGNVLVHFGADCTVCITGRAPLMDFGRVVGTLRVDIDVAPVLSRGALIGSFGLLIGLLLMNLLNRHVLIPLERIKIANLELAFYDSLTGLPNRRLLMDRIGHALSSSSRSGKIGALLFVDLDHFKTINDIHGHDIGDLLLQQVAQRLEFCVREGDTVSRLGGDEFVVMLEDLSVDAQAAAAQTKTVGEKMLAALDQPYQFDKHRFHCSASIGVTLFDGRKFPIDELLKQSDMAMYQSKKAGRNTLSFFDPQMHTSTADHA